MFTHSAIGVFNAQSIHLPFINIYNPDAGRWPRGEGGIERDGDRVVEIAVVAQ